MAGFPAQIDDAPATGDDIAAKNDLVFGFNKLTLLRQIGLMVGLAASVALGVAVVMWARDPSYQPLLTDIKGYDPAEVSQILNDASIQFRIEPRTGALLVASDQIYNARLKLAAAGVTDNRTQGFELLDRDHGLGQSQFMELAQYRRSLEGELARTIASMRNVRSARVHLAIPKASVFVRDARKPSASVFIDYTAGLRLADEQVSAIVNLVASSVPEMNLKDVTLVDQKGNLLTRNDQNSPDALLAKQLAHTSQYEDSMSKRISSILEPIIGAGRFRAEVAADLDFSNVERAEELYNPDQQALRSERVVDEQRSGSELGGIPGALSNQPPAQATAPEVAGANAENTAATAPAGDMRRQATRNYELDRTVSYVRNEQGKVRRLTVAVALDDIRRVDPQTGAVTQTPWPEQELQRMAMLVRDAVGYSAARGDSVTVVNTAFTPVESIDFVAPSFWEQPWFWDLMKQVLAGLVVLVLVLMLLRPTLRSLASGGRSARDRELLGEEGYGGALASDAAIANALSHDDDLLLPGVSESYDRKLNALKGLIAEDPARVAQVMRQWVNADE